MPCFWKGKHFHTEELSFLRAGRFSDLPVTSGWENLRPRRWYPSTWVTRTVRARKIREALGKEFPETRGALGISSRTCAESGKERRTATKAPPAEIFNAVANSNISFPSSSRLRTKIGMASGRRGHFRLSVSGLRCFNRIPQGELNSFFTAPWGPNGVWNLDAFDGKTHRKPPFSLKRACKSRSSTPRTLPYIRSFPDFRDGLGVLWNASFFPSVTTSLRFPLTGRKPCLSIALVSIHLSELSATLPRLKNH